MQKAPDHVAAFVRDADLPALRALLDPLPPAVAATLVAARGSDGHTALHWGAMTEDGGAVLDYLLEKASATDVDAPSGANDQLEQTPLHWACVGGHVGAARALLAAGADAARRDAKGYTAAIHAAQYGRVDVLHVLLSDAPALARAVDALGNGALQWAAYYDHFPAVRYLLVVHEVDVDAVDTVGMSALHRAAQGDRALVADALLRAGADVALRNAEDRTAAQLARRSTRTGALLRGWESGTLTVSRPVARRHTLQRHGLVLFYAGLLLVSYRAYVAYARRSPVLSLGAHVMFHLALATGLGAHAVATFGDPGDVARGDRAALVRHVERSVEKGDRGVSLLPSAYCFTCLAARPARSKHSRDRDACVRLFDHECPWVNNTVGLHNHKPLLLLALCNVVAETIYVVAMGHLLWTVDERSAHGLGRAMFMYPTVTLTTLAHVGVATFCSVLFVTHVRLVMRGQTTYEHLTARRDGCGGASEYDLGTWRNVWAFLTSSGPGTLNELVEVTPQLVFNSLSSTLSSTLSSERGDKERERSTEKLLGGSSGDLEQGRPTRAGRM